MGFTVKVDDRVRLLSAMLAVTTWPLQEQAERPHGVHAHARATVALLKGFEEHSAVLTLQNLLESTLSLNQIFSYVTCLNFPGLRARSALRPKWAPTDWAAQIRDFTFSSRIRDWWAEAEAEVWAQAEAEAERALRHGSPAEILTPFFGALGRAEFVFQPNLCFPTMEPVGFRWGERLYAVVPPQIAWGNNPPWPFDDDPAATQRDAFRAYATVLLDEMLSAHPDVVEAASSEPLPVPNTLRAKFPEWYDQFAVLFVGGLTAYYLRQTFGEPEADAFMLMQHKEHGFEMLPTVVRVLRRYLLAYEDGKFTTFAEYIPVFQRSLRITRRLDDI